MIVGCMVGFVGFIIVILNPLLKEGLSLSLLGNFLLLLSTLTWIYYEVLTKKLHKKYDPKTITFYTFFIGSLPLLPFAAMSFPLLPELIELPVFVFGILWGIIITSFLAFYIWRWGFSRLELSRVGFFAYIDPIVATIAAILILGETLTHHFVAGAVLIFIGLYIAETTIHLPHFHWIKSEMRRRTK